VKRIQLVPIGEVPAHLLERLRAQLPEYFPALCQIAPPQPVPSYSFNASREQYCSTEILARLGALADSSRCNVLGVACFDLYIPILTFVFGEAQLDGSSALVSIHRLRQEVYGFPPDPDLLQDRLLKEAVHELGHSLGLTHCDDRTCVMASSHSVEWIDLKSSDFCPSCRVRASECSTRKTRITV